MRTIILAGLLATGALAVPEPSHRALQSDTGMDSTIATMLQPAIKQFGMDLVTELTTQLAQNSATGTNQLWFRSFDAPVPSLQRCGEVDAAPYMPASLFEPRNFLSLLAYAEATVSLYRTPVSGLPVEVGRCTEAGYSVCGAGIQGIGWFGGMMGTTCAVRCQCSFGFPLQPGLPRCVDEVDDPAAGRFCSLCGPTTACPGCVSNTVSIGLCYLPEDKPTELLCDGPIGTPCPPGVTSRCNTAAGTAVSCGPPPPPVRPTPRPPPPPSADNHLWFRLVQPDFTLGGAPRQCGEIDAAPRMPPELFEAGFESNLQAYTDATIDHYPTGFTGIALEQGRCSEAGFTVPDGSRSQASWAPNAMMRPICTERCDCTYASAFSSTNCQNKPDFPSQGQFCSLCQFYTGSSSFNDYNALATIDLYTEGRASDGDHLYFYYVNRDQARCGEVDAAPYMPATLFEPRHTLELAAYVEATVRLYSVSFRQGFGSSQTVTVQQGRCESVGYSQPKTSRRTGAVTTADAEWTPKEIMGPTCNAACACRWRGQRAACHGSALNNPDTARLCSLPYCDDVALVDDPASGTFCSLCGGPDTVPISLYEQPGGH
jgi:hypothetical protein